MSTVITPKKKSKDSLGDRMKDAYENRTRYTLPRRSYTIMRIDGKAFHTYTKNLIRPFDFGLIDDMNETAIQLCKNITGANFAYVQSDEISILISDFNDIATQAWFDNNLQKMVSISASIATSVFNRLRIIRALNNNADLLGDLLLGNSVLPKHDAHFDARVFQIPQKAEVANYMIWRQQDTVRNSISSVAQSMYSHKQLHGKDSNEKQEMIFQKGINWNDYPSGLKRGRFIEKVTFINGVQEDTNNYIPNEGDAVRHKWSVVECPIFTQDTDFLRSRIPTNE